MCILLVLNLLLVLVASTLISKINNFREIKDMSSNQFNL
jgi:hypothetical protein